MKAVIEGIIEIEDEQLKRNGSFKLAGALLADASILKLKKNQSVFIQLRSSQPATQPASQPGSYLACQPARQRASQPSISLACLPARQPASQPSSSLAFQPTSQAAS